MKPRKDEINSQNSDIEIISQAKSSIIIDELPSNSRHHINTKICQQNIQTSHHETNLKVNQQEQFTNNARHLKLYLSFGKQSDIPISSSRIKHKSSFNKDNFISFNQIKDNSFIKLPQINLQKTSEKQSNSQLPPRRKQKKQSINSIQCIKKWVNPQSSLRQAAMKQKISLKVHKYQNQQIYFIDQPLNRKLYENQLSVMFGMANNQKIQIFSILDPRDENGDSNINIKYCQNHSKYVLQRFYNQFKISVQVQRNGQFKNWKDIEIPVMFTDKNDHKELIIVQKISGEFHIRIDNLDFRFNIETPYPQFKFYGIKSSSIIYEIKLDQHKQTAQKNTPTQPKCEIF